MRRAAEVLDEPEESGGAFSLERAISAVLKRSKLVVATPLIAAIVVAAVVAMIPNRYEAAAVVQIDSRQKSITNIDGVISDLRGDLPTVENEAEIIASRPIILKVIDALDLRNDPEFFQLPLGERLLAKLGFSGGDPANSRSEHRTKDPIADVLAVDELATMKPQRDQVADAFAQALRVSRLRNTLLISIRFTASDASKAARIANTIAEVYLKDQLDSKTHAAMSATLLLEQKIDQMRKKVAEAEHKVEDWKALHNVFESDGQVLSEKQLGRLMEQTVTARSATADARAKYEQAQRLARAGDTGTALVEVLKSGTVGGMKEQLAGITRKAAELKTKYGPKHPEILKINAELAQAEAQLTAEIERLVANLKNETEVAEEREHQLAQSLAQLKEQQVVSKDAGVELKDLEREATTTKQLFEALLVRYKQTAETQGFQLPDVRIIEKADAPQYPTSPKRRQLILLATAAGLILGIAFAVLLELMAPGVCRHDDVERIFEVAHLSSVPSQGAANVVLAPARAVRLVVAEPGSIYADAIRSARRELDMRRLSSEPRVILVTSSIAGEGAELIASNLAHNYAMTGGRPLLIDGDLRLQTLTHQLANQRQRGFLDQILMGQPVEAAILRDGLTGLHFLPAAGQQPPTASIPETLGSSAVAHAIAGLKSQFDTIIIAVPPLLPVIDGRILADYADQIVFVVAWQKTPRQLAKTALKTLGLNDRKLAGVILNNVAPEALNESRGWPLDILGRRAALGQGNPEKYAA